MNDIFFVDTQLGWVATIHGDIYHTDDGGDSWRSQHKAPDGSNLGNIHFFDGSTGWVIGDSFGVLPRLRSCANYSECLKVR